MRYELIYIKGLRYQKTVTLKMTIIKFIIVIELIHICDHVRIESDFTETPWYVYNILHKHVGPDTGWLEFKISSAFMNRVPIVVYVIA